MRAEAVANQKVPAPIRAGNLTMHFYRRPYIMGIMNVTPDSFSDGGKFYDHKRAIDHALKLVEEGADILDVGGESTRPGSDPVPEEEETRRVLPVIQAAVRYNTVPVSIDTTKAGVAKAALDAGAAMVNDVSVRLPVDRKRFYSSGFSGGAHMAFRLAEQLKQPELAGVLPCGGGGPAQRLSTNTVIYGLCGTNCFLRREMARTRGLNYQLLIHGGNLLIPLHHLYKAAYLPFYIGATKRSQFSGTHYLRHSYLHLRNMLLSI